MRDLWLQALDTAVNGETKNTATESDGVRYSIEEIIGDSGKNYGIGVVLDSTLLDGLTDDERKQMVRLYEVDELAGKHFIAYDNSESPVDIIIANKNDKIKTRNGKSKNADEHSASGTDRTADGTERSAKRTDSGNNSA